jgi:hypothetical protein
MPRRAHPARAARLAGGRCLPNPSSARSVIARRGRAAPDAPSARGVQPGLGRQRARPAHRTCRTSRGWAGCRSRRPVYGPGTRGQPHCQARVAARNPHPGRRPAGDDRTAQRAGAAHTHLRRPGRRNLLAGRPAGSPRRLGAQHRGRSPRPSRGKRLAGRNSAHPRRRRPTRAPANPWPGQPRTSACLCISDAVTTSPLTVRIDLDPQLFAESCKSARPRCLQAAPVRPSDAAATAAPRRRELSRWCSYRLGSVGVRPS